MTVAARASSSIDQGVCPMRLSTDDEGFGVVAKHSRFAKEYAGYKKGQVGKMNRHQPNVCHNGYLLRSRQCVSQWVPAEIKAMCVVSQWVPAEGEAGSEKTCVVW